MEGCEITDLYIVTCRTIDGRMWYCGDGSFSHGMSESIHDVSRLSKDVAESVKEFYDNHRKNAVTGEDWDNSYHQVEVRPAPPPVVLCPTIHPNLIELGFVHTHHPADWYDGGDAENGPKLEEGPAYDEYRCDGLEIYVDETGYLDHLDFDPSWDSDPSDEYIAQMRF